MADSSTDLHEAPDSMSDNVRDMHRALVSLQEELEAVDWYQQRAEASREDSLREVLLHNMREEIEHACMVLEWLRRSSEDFDLQLRTYLFKSGSITSAEEQTAGEAPESATDRTPISTIGSLKGV
ncbi:MAG: ferritin [Gammaproteobacteria bacterium]